MKIFVQVINVKDGIYQQGMIDEPIKKDLVNEFTKLFTNEEQANILNGLKKLSAEDMEIETLQKYVNLRKYGK